jgi:hypothetical protein
MNIVWGNDIHANFYNQYEKYDYHAYNIIMVCHPQFQLGTNFGNIRSLLDLKLFILIPILMLPFIMELFLDS